MRFSATIKVVRNFNEGLNMKDRNEIVDLWFEMWLRKEDLGIDEIFAKDAIYIESWGPEYHGVDKIKHWFDEWNSRGSVEEWNIKSMINTTDDTVVEWYFKCKMNDGHEDEFDGISLIKWNDVGQITCLKEFCCNIKRYDPYEKSDQPIFPKEDIKWF